MMPEWANLTKADLKRALRALEPDDRLRIKKMMIKAENMIREKGGETGFNVMFGPLSSMELIAKVGVYFIKKGVNPMK